MTLFQKIHGSGMTALIISNGEIKDIMKVVTSIEGYGLSLKGVNETIENEAKQQKCGFLSILLGILAASLLENILIEKSEISR